MSLPDKISIRSFTILVILFMIGTSILIAPAGLAHYAKQDAWIACLIGILINLALVWVYTALGERFPRQTLVEYSRSLLGRWLGGAAGLLFASFCYVLTALLIGDLGYFLSTQVMRSTPLEALMIIFVVVAGVTVREGMAVYSRTVEILFPWVAFLLAILLLPLFNRFEAQNLQPMLEFGFRPIFKGAASFFSLQELVVLLMLYPFVAAGKGRRRGFMAGTAIGGLVLAIITVGALVVLEAQLTENQLYPAYTLAKNIRLGHMLERVEGMMMFIWICSIFVKTIVSFHAAVIAVNQTFGIRDRRLLVWPLAIGLVPLALMCYTNVVFVQIFISRYWPIYASVFLVALPLLLLGLSYLRPRKGRPAAGKSRYDRSPGRPS